jgi:hypothetical protein
MRSAKLISSSRICVITLIRVIDVARANLQDITRDYAAVGILSILEPLLGIVNCSLPLLRPIILKTIELFGIRRASTDRKKDGYTYGHSIGTKRTRAKVPDVYPLETVATTKEDFQINLEQSELGDESESMKELVEDVHQRNRIAVRRDWNLDFNVVS